MKKLFATLCFLLVAVSLFAQDRYYPLNGDAREMLNGLDGQLGTGTATPTSTTDRFNNPSSALSFDGDDSISIPITGMTGAEFSFSAWLSYPSAPSNLRTWFTVGNHLTTDEFAGLGPTSSSNGLIFSGYRVSLNNYQLTTKTVAPPNQWYHICGVYASSYVKFYVNGLLIDSTTNNGSLPAYGINPKAYIGTRSLNMSGWIGKIDELHYFDHALSDANVAALVANESGVITGTCFLDLNGNSIKDAGESYANGIYVNSTSANRSFSNQTNSSGFFRNLVDTGSIQTSVPAMTNYIIRPLNYVSNHSQFGFSDTVNFALQPIGHTTDVGIVLVPATSAVPGFVASYDIVCTNYGTDTASGTIKLVFDSSMVYLTANPPVDSVAGDTLFWKFSNLYPLQSSTITLQMQLAQPPALNLGDTLNLCATVTSSVPDMNSENDQSCLQQIVVGPHDPNDKTIVEGNKLSLAEVSAGKNQTYVIRFQNTGTYVATNISVTDTLSSSFDLNSFQMVHSSHSYTLTIIDGKILQWQFKKIMLPDSNSNASASHGYICYRLKPSKTLNANDVIRNNAYIYFDFELPIITNTTETSIVESTGLATALPQNGPHIYPNPVNTRLSINKLKPNGAIRIFNSLGEKVKEVRVEKENIELPVTDLPAGLYYLTYSNNKAVFSRKFIKE